MLKCLDFKHLIKFNPDWQETINFQIFWYKSVNFDVIGINLCLFCELYSTSFLQNIQDFWYESSIDMFHTQNINQNTLSRSIRNVGFQCYFVDANMTIFKHFYFNFFDVIAISRVEWMTRKSQVFDDFMALTECCVPYQYLCSS